MHVAHLRRDHGAEGCSTALEMLADWIENGKPWSVPHDNNQRLRKFHSMLSLITRVAAMGMLLTNTASAATLADFASDFSALSNPAGAWAYGATATPGGPLALATQLTRYGAGLEVAAWSPTGTAWPTIGLNESGSAVSFGAGNVVTLAAGQGLLHPGPGGEFADVRYTVQSGFAALLAVEFVGVDAVGTTTDVHVLLNGLSLFDDVINGFGDAATFSTTRTFAAGDVLEFAVGFGGNGNFVDDSTGFRATLTTVPVPGAAWLLATGFVAVGGVRRARLAD